MRKILLIFTLLLTLALVACGKKETPNVVISKVYGASNDQNNLIELYNNSDKDINLKNFKIDFYKNGDDVVNESIKLSGTIKANDYFVIGSNGFQINEHKDKIDFIHNDDYLPFNGDDVFELVFNKTVIDQFGTVGASVIFSANVTYIRLGDIKDYKPSKTFNKFNYIFYIADVFEYLKNDDYEIKYLEDLLAGPKLEQKYFDLPFSANNKGTGGVEKVTVVSIADGDTATFRPVDPNSTFTGGNSMRYYYIDTPEINGTYVKAQPWGYVASKYNKEFILKDHANKEVYIQSIPGGALTETNGRWLGLVWVNGSLAQFLVTSEGLTDNISPQFDSSDNQLTYKKIPYKTFLLFAENRARLNGWGTKGYSSSNPIGEKSPDWNYEANKNTTSNPVWTPHLPLPWA